MGTWELFKSSAKKAANKAIRETGDAADLASLHIKLKSIEAKRNEEYEMLGRLTYRQLKTGISQAERIAPVIENLDKMRAKIRNINDQIEEVKKNRSERREREKADFLELELQEYVDETIADEAQSGEEEEE